MQERGVDLHAKRGLPRPSAATPRQAEARQVVGHPGLAARRAFRPRARDAARWSATRVRPY